MTSNSTVDIKLSRSGEVVPLRTMDEAIIAKGSLTIRKALEGQTGAKKTVILSDRASAGPLKAILERIEQQKENLFIKTHKFTWLLEGIMVWQACEALNVQPQQPKILCWIIQKIAHKKITQDQMLAICRAFSKDSKPIAVMIHQIGWDLVHSKYTEAEANELQKAAKTIPALHDAIDGKVKELDDRRHAWVWRRYGTTDRS